VAMTAKAASSLRGQKRGIELDIGFTRFTPKPCYQIPIRKDSAKSSPAEAATLAKGLVGD
jgi:hypothetical protein